MVSHADLIGCWELVSNRNWSDDGVQTDPFGKDPLGILLLTADGRMSIFMSQRDLPEFSAGNRLKGSAEENAAVVHGTLAAFGSYEVQEAAAQIVLTAEGCTFPNLMQKPQIRPYTVDGDQMLWKLKSPTVGGYSEIVWRKYNA